MGGKTGWRMGRPHQELGEVEWCVLKQSGCLQEVACWVGWLGRLGYTGRVFWGWSDLYKRQGKWEWAR